MAHHHIQSSKQTGRPPRRRTWHPLSPAPLLAALSVAEAACLDVASDPDPPEPESTSSSAPVAADDSKTPKGKPAAAAAGAGGKAGAVGAKGGKGAAAAEPVVTEVKVVELDPSKLPLVKAVKYWMNKASEASIINTYLTTMHRCTVRERDYALLAMSEGMMRSMQAIRAKYRATLEQEQSWMERWNRQVEILRQGDIF